MIEWKPKKRQCKATGCSNRFLAHRPNEWWCSPECGAVVALAKMAKVREKDRREKERQAKKSTREQREKLKTRAKWLAEAQAAFNAYIRARDDGKPCISCETLHTAQWDAGHYRSVGAAAHLRFNEDNVHRQCSRPCNKDKSGNLIEYRKGLVQRIGLERVEALENDNRTVRLSIEEIKAIKAKYAAMKKAVERAALLQLT